MPSKFIMNVVLVFVFFSEFGGQVQLRSSLLILCSATQNKSPVIA